MASFKNNPLRRWAKGFAKGEGGAILVEFALVMPLMLLLLAVMFESGRLMWTYQMVNAGVRDAGRYLARTAPIDICISGGSVAGYAAKMKEIVEEDISGTGLFPVHVTINSVTPSISCISGTYRTNPAPVGIVTASMTIEFPFSGIMALFGGTLGTTTTLVTDQSRVYGQ